jgi:hypothetical protein
MRLLPALIVGTFALGGVAQAQPLTPSAEEKGYIEAVGQSSFGNVTSQSFGVEGGVTIAPRLQLFGEVGKTRDVATASLGSKAQRLAAGLAGIDPALTYSVKQPVLFGAAGLRYLLAVSDRAQPYVLGGVGLARVTQDVKFLSGSTDVTANLQQAPYYTVLGSDLSGDFRKPMLLVGGGVAVPAWRHGVFDFQVRLARILADDEGITVARAGLGVGVRF